MFSRAAFEDDALVYASTDDDPAWHAVSQCVWSSAARLRDRVSLNDDYEDLRELFVDLLGVKPVSLEMAVEELKETGGRDSASVDETKDSIWTVNSLLLHTGRPPRHEEAAKCKIFPIRYPDGAVRRESVAAPFFINDREKSRESFEGKVSFLDFTLDEVARLRPFLRWMRLEDRHLSNCVKEVTSFHGQGARPVSNPDRQISNRAHALLRYISGPKSRPSEDVY